MKRILPGLSFVFLFNCLFGQTVYKDYTDGQIYIKFTKTALKEISQENPRNIPLFKLATLGKLLSKYGVTKAYKPFYQASDDAILPYVLKFEFTKAKNVDAFIEELNGIPGIEYAEKVSFNKIDAIPNDPSFATPNGSVHLNQINAQNAWNVFNGNSNITVAIVDNAVMWTHADLAANTYTNTGEIAANGIDDDGNGYIDDRNGWDVANWDNNTVPTNNFQDHGTHCAGIAGGVTNNSTGIASIGWNIKIIPVKSSFDVSAPALVDKGYEGILYAVKAKARIISCSWGSGGFSNTEQAVVDYAWTRGCIVMASAGNASANAQNYPGTYANAFCIAAVNLSDVKSGYSNYGTWVDISAPGDNILSTVPYSTPNPPAYQSYSGTSMATPLVAGLAGLMLSKSPLMTNANVLFCIASTAVNVYTISGNSGYVSGSLIGVGRIDAYAAMLCASSYSALPPVANFYAFPKNTCPNAVVPFYDSSLYAPTSWSWVFQGGTPATSTSSNPSVQWSTPGTYSVSLTVSNANGNNSITKLSYVTVAGPVALPLAEGFENLPFLPANWTPNNIWNDNIYWARVTGVGGFGTSTACAIFDNYVLNAPQERDEMRTPKYSFSNVANAQLHFDVAYARYNASFSDTLEAKVSTDCGTTWTNVYLKGGTVLSTKPDQSNFFVPTANQWRTENINISTQTAGQGNVMFSFLNRGHYGQPIYLDNINLVFPIPSPGVSYPVTSCPGYSVTFNNTSTGAGAYLWSFQGGSPATSSAQNPVISYATPGTYTLSLSAINGTATALITRTITIHPFPTITATSPSICSGSSATLTANGATSYTWTSGSSAVGNGSTLIVPIVNTTTFSVEGNSGGCVSQITTTAFANAVPVSVLSTTNSACAGTLCSGMVNASTSGGSGPFTYSLVNGGNCSALPCTNLCAGSYSLVTTNNAGCSSTDVFSISVPAPVQAVISGTNSTCASCTDGVLSVTVSGGVGPFSYTWSPSGGNSSTSSGIAADCYTVTIQDANNCASYTTACISVATGLTSYAALNALKIYPNPAKDILTIDFQGAHFGYTIYNSIGQLIAVRQQNKNLSVINISEFAKGVYLIQISSGQDKFWKKIIVE